MQGYKRIILFCFVVYFMATTLTTYSNIKQYYTLKNSKEVSIKNLDKFLKKNENKSKIIIFGASVTLFGLSAEKFNKQLSLPAINISSYGTATALNQMLENEILTKLTDKDLLIFADWRWRTNQKFQMSFKKKSFFEIIKDNFQTIPNLNLIKENILFIPKWHYIRTLNGDVYKNHYNSNDFNEVSIPKKILDNFNSNKLLKEQLRIMNNTKAKIYLSFSPNLVNEKSVESYIQYNKKFINYFETLNKNQNIFFIKKNFAYLDKNLFNDNQHLNFLGREVWSNELIHELRNYISK